MYAAARSPFGSVSGWDLARIEVVRVRMVSTRWGIIGADARPNWKGQPQCESLTDAQ
jgi:hypothetical protein